MPADFHNAFEMGTSAYALVADLFLARMFCIDTTCWGMSPTVELLQGLSGER